MNIQHRIKTRKARVAIIGMGYVGLPHAVIIARAGFSVLGIDIQQKRVDMLNKGISYIGDINDRELKEILARKNFIASLSFDSLRDVDVVIVCVPTPLDKHKVPDISYIKDSLQEIKKYLHKDQLIILESTTYPGTTEEVVLPMLQETGLKAGEDFYLAFAPERIDPGNTMAFSDIPKVVGGVTVNSTEIAELFYKQFLKSVHTVSSAKTAEMTKILENTYRLVNISAINELALLCGKMNIDIWEVIEAAKTKPYGYTPFYPSPGVGGHCIPLDPFYLSWKAKEYNFWSRFIELAGEINEQMPHFVVTKAMASLNQFQKSLNGSKILIWGVAYKKDIADTRESAAHDIIADLIRKQAQVEYFDPFVKEFSVNSNLLKKPIVLHTVAAANQQLQKYDLVIIVTDHSGFDYEKLAKSAKLVVDTRNAVKSRKHKHVKRL